MTQSIRDHLRLPAVLAVLALALPAAPGCSRREAGPPAATHAAAAAVDTSGILVPATSAGLRALAARPGARATLLNVWATWCGPCRDEFPALLAAARRHRDVRLLLASADFTAQRAEVVKFLAGHGVRDTTYLKDEADQAFIDGLDRRWSGALPATFVLDAAGRTVDFWEGAADSSRFEAALARVLSSSPATP